VAAELCWAAGAGLNLGLSGVLFRRWLSGPGNLERLSPVWLMPAIGDLVVPLAGGRLGYRELSWFFFAGGIGLWLMLAPALFQRLAFRRPLTEAQFPWVFLILAPPAVGALALSGLGQPVVEPAARLLMFIALFLALGLVTLVPRFLRAKFSLAWWAFAFPAAALAQLLLLYHDALAAPGSHYLAVLALLAATALTGVATIATLRAALTGTLGAAERGGPVLAAADD
jgi:tellurite resistance protein